MVFIAQSVNQLKRGVMRADPGTMADVMVYAPRCPECGRVGDGARAWDTPADAPMPLPACRCGGSPALEALDVNQLWLRASMTGFVAARPVTVASGGSRRS